MNLILTLVYFLTLWACAFSKKTDYCRADLCAANEKHVACRNSGAFHSNCKSPELVDLKPYWDTIVELHNVKRNLIAGGKVSNYPPAAKMATMQWGPELAYLAYFNVLQCDIKHDKCHNTDVFKKSGQNLAESSSSSPILDLTKKLPSIVDSWFDEYQQAKPSYIAKYPYPYSGPKIGHFTAMVKEDNTHVGCAAVRYKKEGMYSFLLACNYATSNIGNYPIYTSSSKGGSACRKKNSKYAYLCSKTEKYAMNYGK